MFLTAAKEFYGKVSDEEKTILVIDADEHIQEKLVEVMSDKPCRFVFEDKATEAIVQLAMEFPNFLIVSMEMPDGEGAELLENIREFDPDIPMIVLTAAPTKEKLIAAKRAKAVDILMKPPDYGRIKSRLAAHLWVSEELLAARAAGGAAAAAPGGPDQKKPVKEEDKTFEQLAAEAMGKIAADSPREDFVEAIPKGAELLNINDAIAGMKVAKTLIFNDVVYADKGEILTDKKLEQLSRMGAPEVVVYINEELKKKVEARKKAMAAKAAIGTKTPTGEKTFAKVKRAQVRVKTEEPAKVKRKLMDGSEMTVDGQVADMSGGGCALLTAEPLTKDEEIALTFSLDGGSFPMENVRGLVRHSMRRFGTDELPYRSGIFFNSITERFRENLITKLFKIERDNKKKEDEMRARFGYGPKKFRKRD